MAEADNPWKQGFDELYPHAMRMFLPEAAARQNWTRKFEPLESEIQSLFPTSQTGVKRVDKFVKTWCRQTPDGKILKKGAENEEFYHFEICQFKEPEPEKRASDYNKVASTHVREIVVTTLILLDEDLKYRPCVYTWTKDGNEFTFKFNLVKLADLRGKEVELFNSDNPFALFVLGNLKVLPTSDNDELRATEKLGLWKKACEHPLAPKELSCLLRIIDWILLLPTERNRALLREFEIWRENNPMPFVSVFEQRILDQEQVIADQKQLVADREQLIADQKQLLRENSLRGIKLGLKLKFKDEGLGLFALVQKQTDSGLLLRFLDAIDDANSLEDLRKLLP